MDFKHFFSPDQPVVKVVSPSNIALIKYWGKSIGLQIPANPSLSMTLKNAVTTTYVQRADRDACYLNGRNVTDGKMIKHLEYLRKHVTQNEGFPVALWTSNSFPTASGIASSASGLSALTVAVLALWTHTHSFEDLNKKGFSKSVLANYSRIGSGSAGRSLWGGFVLWKNDESSSIQPVPTSVSLADTIVLIDSEAKAISSTEGHQGAWSSPFFEPRLAAVPERLEHTLEALRTGNIERLLETAEADAYDMHAVMMTQNPPLNFWKNETSHVLAFVRHLRQKGIQAYATVDAGANVHVLSRLDEQELIAQHLTEQFPRIPLFKDRMGEGPTLSLCTLENSK